MDTPERNQIGTSSLSKFEDSPVFNYINSLSPIKPVKSINISQSFNSLSFASVPSVFTSPHLKEFRFLRRHQTSDQCSTDDGNKIGSSEGTTDAFQLSGNSSVPLEGSLGETSFDLRNEHPKLESQLTRSLNFDCASPDGNPKTSNGGGKDGVPELAVPLGSLTPHNEVAPEKALLPSEMHLKDICQTEQKKEELGCDWENLISDATDLLIFSSPDGSETLQGPIQKLMDPINFGTLVSEFPEDDVNDLQRQCYVPVSSVEQVIVENHSGEMNETHQAQDSLANASPGKCMTNQQFQTVDEEAGKGNSFTLKPVLNLHRGMRRRCLVFEMSGAHRKTLNNASDAGSSNLKPLDGNVASNDKQLVPLDTPRRIFPGIGLHLNSLATTSRGHRIVKHEVVATESKPIMSTSGSNAPFHSPSIDQEPSTDSLALTCNEENGSHLAEDILQASADAAIEELSQSSPKKKRRKLEAGETEACKRCNCKKSKCLKLYCECFAAGVYCVESCSCQECFNKPIHEDTVLSTRKQIESRNPLAFAPKVIRGSDSIAEIGDELNKTPASARHKRGCNCKKSSCLKKYCECYQGGVGCSISCRCEGCKNAFGRKDETEAEQEEEETEASEKSAVDEHLQKAVVNVQNPDSAPPITPLQIGRKLLQLPFPSKRKPPRSSFLATKLTSALRNSTETIGKSNLLQSQHKFEKKSENLAEDEMPDVLRNNGSPSAGIKTASPNSKRVSPPQSDFGSSPTRRSGRKLILQSIPSFPSLTQH